MFKVHSANSISGLRSQPVGSFAHETIMTTFQLYGSEQPVCSTLQVWPAGASATNVTVTGPLCSLLESLSGHYMRLWPFYFTDASAQGLDVHIRGIPKFRETGPVKAASCTLTVWSWRRCPWFLCHRTLDSIFWNYSWIYSFDSCNSISWFPEVKHPLFKRTREISCGFGHVQNFIRSAESGTSAVNKSSKCERCFIIIILIQYSCLVRNCS